MTIGPNTKGRDFNFFQKLTVTTQIFGTDPDVNLVGSLFNEISLVNEGSVAMEFSFNGNTVHGELTPNTLSSGITLTDVGATKYWFRLKTTGSSVVRVQTNASTTGVASTSGGSVSGIVGVTGPVNVIGTVGMTGTMMTDTELPSAVQITDAFANPTAPAVDAKISGWNSVTWDRLKAGQTGTFTGVGGMLNAVPVGIYNATKPALTDGYATLFQLTSNGSLSTSETFIPAAEDNSNAVIAQSNRFLANGAYSPSIYTNFAAATKANIKASPGILLGIQVYNTTASVRFLGIHNLITAPTATLVPYLPFFLIPGNSQIIIGSDFFTSNGIRMSVGLGYSWSTTANNFTDGGAISDLYLSVIYV